jgi:hypothetical protein
MKDATALHDALGWAATTVFVGSYFCARPERLRRMQMLGALMWMAYGLLKHALPVVVANLLVLGAAAWTAKRALAAPPAGELAQTDCGTADAAPGSGRR